MFSRAVSKVSSGARALSTVSGLNEAVIVSYARTPIGMFNGSMASVTGPQLGSIAVKAAIARAGIQATDVDDVILGNVLAAGAGQAPSRQVALGAGIPESVPCTDINKVCASGMKSIMFAAQNVMMGYSSVVVCGGFESMSNVPFYLDNRARSGLRMGNGKIIDGVVHDGLWDVYNDFHMGMCGEKCAEEYGFTRESQDAYALSSYERAQAAASAGEFKDEIVPVEIKGRGGKVTTIDSDEEVFKLNKDKFTSLRSAFKKDGTITAGNASKLNDGAAALIVMSADKARQLGVTPLARIRGFADAARAPVDFTTAPALAVPKAYAMAGVDKSQIDLHEINEAFSVVAQVNTQILELDAAKVNVRGGAVALGHPIGMSGARIVGAAIQGLTQRGGSIADASICNGGGGASAIVLERL